MYVGVNKLHLGLLGITEQFVLTMHGIGHIWEIYCIQLIFVPILQNIYLNLYIVKLPVV